MYFSWYNISPSPNELALHFDYNGICRFASSSGSQCFSYEADPGPIVPDNEVLNWYRQQLSSFDGALAMAGTVFAVAGCSVVPLTLYRVISLWRCRGGDTTRWSYNLTSRALLLVAAVQLIGALMVAAAYSRLREFGAAACWRAWFALQPAIMSEHAHAIV